MREKNFWQNIIENKGALPENESLESMTNELLGYLTSPDGELRDTFGYQILAHWILTGHYEKATLNNFLKRWLGNLEEGLGESGTDSVLVRSFAALMLSILIYYDMQQDWISGEDYALLLDKVLNYFGKEQDLRAYDNEKGWLHATAHSADVLKFLARDSKTDKTGLERILDAIAQKLKSPQALIFTHGEDERLALVFLDILKRQVLEEESLKIWLEGFKEIPNGMGATTLDPKQYAVHQNSKNFLKALYFVLAKNKEIVGASNLEYVIYGIMKGY